MSHATAKGRCLGFRDPGNVPERLQGGGLQGGGVPAWVHGTLELFFERRGALGLCMRRNSTLGPSATFTTRVGNQKNGGGIEIFVLRLGFQVFETSTNTDVCSKGKVADPPLGVPYVIL